MKKENNLILYVLIFLALGFSFISLVRPAQMIKTIENSVGALSSPELSSSYFSVNGLVRYYNSVKTANLPSSTICSIKSPSATSTLVASSVRFISGNTASSVTWAYKGATVSATTTALYGGVTVGAGAQGTFHATTTTDSRVFAPNNYLIVDTSANYAQVGYCNATFEVI